MYNIKYPKLFTPIRLRGTEFRNRLFAAPNGFHDITPEHFPSPQSTAFFERRARGGMASVTIGECIVDRHTGAAHPYHIYLDDYRALPRMSAFSRAVSRHGAVASVELQHCGMFSHYVHEQGGRLLGPVDMELPDAHRVNNDGHAAPSDGGMRRIYAMTESEIDAFIASFARAAALAKSSGFGMVMIHGGHGWALSQFMSPYTNTRRDRWGGSFENRMRLPLAVTEAVRRAVGNAFPIELRISGSECMDGGYGIEEGIRIAKAFDGVVDLINVSAGHHEKPEAMTATHPSMFMDEGCNVHLAAEIKKHIKTPVSTVGALTDPAMMEEIIASGMADVIELGRQSLADPDFALFARAGRDEDINKCIRCCMCYESGRSTRQRGCSVNPEVGDELEYSFASPAPDRKRILVAGGGIAGMQAALTAARRGHDVTLYEKTGDIGGVLRCERSVPFKKRLGEYLDRQASLLARAGVKIHTGKAVTPELAADFSPDVLIAALGGTAAVPPIKGLDGANVMMAERAFAAPESAQKRVVIIGGGLVGGELAVYLSQLGREVTILELLPEMSDGGNQVHADAVKLELARQGVAVYLGTRATEILPDAVQCRTPAGDARIPADSVICAAGFVPLAGEADALRFCAPEFHKIGDCLTPKNILAATRMAHAVAINIGRA